MPRSINLSGTPGKKYDLDVLTSQDTRTSNKEELVVQVWYWNPKGIDAYKSDEIKFAEHRNPNPPNPELGQIWLSKLVPTDFKED